MNTIQSHELLMLFVYILLYVAIPVIAYKVGKRAGYKQGQLDMYKAQEGKGF